MGFQLTHLIERFTAAPWPDAKPLPEHVRVMKINHEALALHVSRAAREPSVNRQRGYGKKVKQ